MSRVFSFRYPPLAAAAICLACCLGGCGGGSSGAAGSGGAGGMVTGTGGSGNSHLAQFSFFVVSKEAVVTLSGSPDGFGGDLRFGEATGLAGADKICAGAAEMGLAGAGAKTWRAFLSASSGGLSGGALNAKDRVGTGPWHDAVGRLVASTLDQLLMNRPGDADAAIKNDLPNETGLPNHMDGAPGCTGSTCPDNHQVLTGSGADGALYTATTPLVDATCDDWTSKAPSGHPRTGHSWPRQGSGTNWISDEDGAGCAPCTTATPSTACVGATGSYGGFYCFALAGG